MLALLLLICALAVSACSWPAAPCKQIQADAVEALAGVNACMQIPGCQVEYADLMEVRRQVKAGQVCEAKQ